MPVMLAAVRGAFFCFCVLGFGVGNANADVDIYIDKSNQRMTVSVEGVHLYQWDVSTGKRRYETPSGTFQPFRMEPDHFSTEWNDAPMPHSIFFTYQGHAIHGTPKTRRLGRAVSHGCVRLAPQDAATLYSLVEQYGMGKTKITILDSVTAEASGIY